MLQTNRYPGSDATYNPAVPVTGRDLTCNQLARSTQPDHVQVQQALCMISSVAKKLTSKPHRTLVTLMLFDLSVSVTFAALWIHL